MHKPNNLFVKLPLLFLTLLLFFSLSITILISPAYASSGFTTDNGVIKKDGNPIVLRGVNVFGFESDLHTIHGLWARNWKDMINQMKSVGFNAVRIPLCPDTIHGSDVKSIDTSLNPDLAGLNSIQVLDKFVNEFSNQGMYTLLDFHRPDCYAQSDLWYSGSYSEENWLNDVKTLAQRYSNVSNFIGIDLKNEPKGSASWGTGNTSTDWNTAAEKAGALALSVNPNILMFVEGVSQNPICSNSQFGFFWGENLQAVNCKGIDNSKIPANKLVLSPHIYGPDVYNQPYFNTSDFPNNMPAIWNEHFGYLTDKGYTIVPGEWGGKYGNGGDQKDVTWQNALVNYYQQKGICSSFYWSWNPNSGDTGGVLQDDWTNLWSNKVQMLKNFFNGCKQANTNFNTTNNSNTNQTTNTQKPVQQSTVNNNCNVKYSIRDFWNNGFTADITVTNNTGKDINGWQMSWTLPNGQNVSYLWSGDYWSSGNTANAKNTWYNANIPNGGNTQFGIVGGYYNGFSKPNDFKLNGINCSVN